MVKDALPRCEANCCNQSLASLLFYFIGSIILLAENYSAKYTG
jgi:hypothetical protein